MTSCSRQSARRCSRASASWPASGCSPAITSPTEWPSWSAGRATSTRATCRRRNCSRPSAAQVLLGSVYVRDALLDPNPATADDYRRQLEESYQHRRRGAEAIRAGRWTCRASRCASIGCAARSTTSAGRCSRCSPPTAASGRPRRATCCAAGSCRSAKVVIRVSEEVQALNRSAFVQQQVDIAASIARRSGGLADRRPRARREPRDRAARRPLYAGRLEQRLSASGARDVETPATCSVCPRS